MNKHTLQNFIAHVKSTGLPVASHYYIEIKGIQDKSVWMLCDQAHLPGLNVMTAEKRTYGETRETPYGITYGPLQLSVILDNTGNGKRMFDEWANRVYNRRTRTLGYYDKFTADVNLYLVDFNTEKSKVVYAVAFKECYPKMIGDIQLDYSNHDILKSQITLAYKYWVEIDENGQEIAPPGDANLIPGTNFEQLSNPAAIALGGGLPIGPSLQAAGFNVGTNIGTAAGALGTNFSLSGMTGGSSLGSAFQQISVQAGQLGAGISSLGQNLQNITAPISAIRGAVGAVAGTLGTVDAVLNTIGLGKPFGKVSGQLTSISGQLGQVAGLKGVPGLIGGVGASMAGVAGAVQGIQKSFDQVPGVTKALSGAWNKFGKVTATESYTINQSASELMNYTGTLDE